MVELIKKAIAHFNQILGKENCLYSREDLMAYSFDAKFEGRVPLAVLRPDSTKQVSKIAALCHEYKIPMIPRGAGTGTAGGAVPVTKAIIIELVRMNRILEISADEMLARAQAGVITSDLDIEAGKVALMYGPDPASSETSTIGGNAATCAGGLRAVKYGVTKHHILELVVVLANGDVIKTGVRTKKGVVGYDLTELFVGSEGTLGIITEITLRLIPRPESKKTLISLFNNLEQAGQCVINILRAGITPVAIELMDRRTLEAVGKSGENSPDYFDDMLLIEVAGPSKIALAEAEIVKKVCNQSKAKTVKMAKDEMEVKSLWEARRSISPALYKLRPHKISEDVAVPVPKLVELVKGFQRIAESYNLLWAAYGHAGDGNLHANILMDKSDKDETNRAGLARKELFDLVLLLGGTLSGEHGVGAVKRDFIAMEISPENLAVQRAIKNALDPLNILNPEKILPD